MWLPVSSAETGLDAAAMPPAFCGLRPLANLPRVLKSRSCSCFSGLQRLRGACLCRAGQPANLLPRWQSFAPLVGAVALRGSAAHLGRATRSPPCGDSALHRLFTSSLLGSITTDFASYPQVGLCVLKRSVCSCVLRARPHGRQTVFLYPQRLGNALRFRD